MITAVTRSMSSSPNFSVAFQQVASVVAISKTRDPAGVLDELVKQCLVILPNEPLGTPESIAAAIQTLFGIELSLSEIALAVQRLDKAGSLVQLPGNQIGLSSLVRTGLQARIADARRLEEEIRQSWLDQVHIKYPELAPGRLWEVLKVYLGYAFRRHGVQAVALFDPSAEVNEEQVGSLSPILGAVIRERFDESEYADVRDAISSFFITVSADRQRAEYIAQLADGAFNYFSLTIAPEVAALLRSKLSPLILFLDTNFLFGILHLHVNSQVDVSEELLEGVRRFDLPFALRYHQATAREMNNTLLYFRGELRAVPWTQTISRAASKSGRFRGIELRYHEVNGVRSVAVDDFFSPYDHWDVLVKEKGISIYKTEPSDKRLRARADLEAEYRAFLIRAGRDKPDEAIQHDMTVLETVRSLRSETKSSLTAGALLVTCDIQLFRFDAETSRRDNRGICVVLPSLLWQILRPFITDGANFDQAFAETFALPEFSLGRGGAAKAASRLLSILASCGGVPEEIASRMLANDLLLARLQTTPDDAECAQVVELALLQETEDLIEENAALEQQLSAEKANREARERELATITTALREKERTVAQREETLREKEVVVEALQQERQQDSERVRGVVDQVLKERQEKENAEARLKDLQQEKEDADRRALLTAKIASVVVAFLVVLLFEALVNAVLPWDWLLKHPNSYGLQGCISLMLFFGILGIWVRPWRKSLLVTGFAGAMFVLLQIVGGSSQAR